MSTMLATEVTIARRTEVRFRIGYLDEVNEAGYRPPLSIGEAVDYMQGIENLLFLAAVANWNGPSEDTSMESPTTFVSNVLVKRLSYASPMEVVLTFGTGLGVATLATNRLLALWRNWSATRRQVAFDAASIAAANVLQATIDAPIPINPDTPGYARFQQAAHVLSVLSELEVREEA